MPRKKSYKRRRTYAERKEMSKKWVFTYATYFMGHARYEYEEHYLAEKKEDVLRYKFNHCDIAKINKHFKNNKETKHQDYSIKDVEEYLNVEYDCGDSYRESFSVREYNSPRFRFVTGKE